MKRRALVAVAMLAAVALVTVALLAAQPQAEADCCPCEREAAYVNHLETIKARWDRNPFAPALESVGDTLGDGETAAFGALVRCLDAAQ